MQPYNHQYEQVMEKFELKVVIKELPIDLLEENVGQIPFVPENPRRITDEAFELLKRSISESPEGRILGISKIARVVGYCAARLQLQERLAREIMQTLSDALEGKHQGMAIVMKGTHLCKSMRGVKSQGEMSVSVLTGIFKQDGEARREFYKLIDAQKR